MCFVRCCCARAAWGTEVLTPQAVVALEKGPRARGLGLCLGCVLPCARRLPVGRAPLVEYPGSCVAPLCQRRRAATRVSTATHAPGWLRGCGPCHTHLNLHTQCFHGMRRPCRVHCFAPPPPDYPAPARALGAFVQPGGVSALSCRPLQAASPCAAHHTNACTALRACVTPRPARRPDAPRPSGRGLKGFVLKKLHSEKTPPSRSPLRAAQTRALARAAAPLHATPHHQQAQAPTRLQHPPPLPAAWHLTAQNPGAGAGCEGEDVAQITALGGIDGMTAHLYWRCAGWGVCVRGPGGVWRLLSLARLELI